MRQTISEEERQRESIKQRTRHLNTIKITVGENALIVTEGDLPNNLVAFDCLEAALPTLIDFIERRQRIQSDEETAINNGRGLVSKNMRLASRREGKRVNPRRGLTAIAEESDGM